MKPFIFSFPLSRTGDLRLTLLTPEVQTLEAGVDSASESFYWPLPYVASDFEPVATNSGVTKPYFLLYSTDHALQENSGCYLAQADDPYLTNFEEIGMVSDLETPRILKSTLVNDDEYFHYYFHGHLYGIVQKTQLYTTSNKSLIGLKSTWTSKGYPLEQHEDAGENHSGYFNPIRRSSDWIGAHTIQGGGVKSGYDTSLDGRTWARQAIYPLPVSSIPEYEGYIYPVQASSPFKFRGKYYAVDSIRPEGTINVINEVMVLAEIDIATLMPIKHIAFLGDGVVRSVTAYLSGNVLYVYIMRDKTHLSIMSYTLS